MQKISLVFIVLVLASCQYFESAEPDRPVARVNDRYLNASEIAQSYPGGLSSEDSIKWAQGYINQWGKEQLVLQRAELNLSEEQKDVERQIRSYRNSLIRHIYEQKLVKQKLDTSISASNIADYYEENQAVFPLREGIMRVIFVAVDKNAPKLDELRQSIRLVNPGDRYSLEEYCRQYASHYQLNDSTWIPLPDLKIQIPPLEPSGNPEQYFKWNNTLELQDSTKTYFVRVQEFLPKGTLAPLPFVENQIREIIIHHRKIELLKNMESSMFEDAIRKNHFEIY